MCTPHHCSFWILRHMCMCAPHHCLFCSVRCLCAHFHHHQCLSHFHFLSHHHRCGEVCPPHCCLNVCGGGGVLVTRSTKRWETNVWRSHLQVGLLEKLDMFSWWTFSDVFEEDWMNSAPFHNGCVCAATLSFYKRGVTQSTRCSHLSPFGQDPIISLVDC
jgi:hypothetical protein